MTKKRIAVIAGAGPAGLTAAYELRKRTDIHPVVLEMTDALGGIAQTHNYKGNRIDIGGHRFFSKDQRVMNWWFNILPLQGAPSSDDNQHPDYHTPTTEVVLDYLCPASSDGSHGHPIDDTRVRRKAPDPEVEDQVMLSRRRFSRIFYRNAFFPYPLYIALDVARRLGLWNTFLIACSFLWARVFPERDETYLDAFFKNRFGRRLYQTFFKDYTEKVWGVSCDKIRADWGAQRIEGLSLKRAIVQAVRDLRSGGFEQAQRQRETSLITRFFYPKFGPGQMWETVAGQLRACGGEVYLGHAVTGVVCTDNRITEVIVEGSDNRAPRSIPCDFFISTMPIRRLVEIMSPPAPPEVCEVARGLVYRDFMTVGLLVRRLYVKEAGKAPAERTPDTWIYIQDGSVRLGRVQIFNNWSPYMVSNAEDSIWLGLEYFVNDTDELWQWPDAQVIEFAVDELARIDFLRPEDVVDGCVLRMPKAYPAYLGTYDELDIVRKWANSIPNLFLCGRNGMHRYNNQDHSMLTAMLAVDNIIEGRHDDSNIWDVNVEMVYHEGSEAPRSPSYGANVLLPSQKNDMGNVEALKKGEFTETPNPHPNPRHDL